MRSRNRSPMCWGGIKSARQSRASSYVIRGALWRLLWWSLFLHYKDWHWRPLSEYLNFRDKAGDDWTGPTVPRSDMQPRCSNLEISYSHALFVERRIGLSVSFKIYCVRLLPLRQLASAAGSPQSNTTISLYKLSWRIVISHKWIPHLRRVLVDKIPTRTNDSSSPVELMGSGQNAGVNSWLNHTWCLWGALVVPGYPSVR